MPADSPVIRSSLLPWDARFYTRSALFVPLTAVASELRHCADWPSLPALDHLLSHRPLRSGAGIPLTFVAPDSIGGQSASGYEARAYLAGELETRVGNWHVLFNAFVWLSLPLSKAAINARHYHALQVAPMGTQRGAERDALTLFDESGVIVACDDPTLLDLLDNFAWKELFWHRREDVIARMRFYLFGHGLYEKALRPFAGLTGKAVFLSVDQVFLAATMRTQLTTLDDRLAALIMNELLHPRELRPLPLLGIPGWSEENQRESYYDNHDYFRPGRQKSG